MPQGQQRQQADVVDHGQRQVLTPDTPGLARQRQDRGGVGKTWGSCGCSLVGSG